MAKAVRNRIHLDTLKRKAIITPKLSDDCVLIDISEHEYNELYSLYNRLIYLDIEKMQLEDKLDFKIDVILNRYHKERSQEHGIRTDS